MTTKKTGALTVFARIYRWILQHQVFVVAIVPIIFGLASWQYCKGYFGTLGISISYSLADNLIFVFDQLVRLTFRSSAIGLKTAGSFFVQLLGSFTAIVLISKGVSLAYGKINGKYPVTERLLVLIAFFGLTYLFLLLNADSILPGLASMAVLGLAAGDVPRIVEKEG